MNLKILSFLLLAYLNVSQCQPILQNVVNWLSGIKYVPPQAVAVDETPEKLFQPVDKISLTENNVVFNRTGGWLQPAGSQYLYLMGNNSASFYEAKYFCAEEGGHLAEIYSDHEMELVKTMLQREPSTNFWLGLEKSSRTWLTSGKARNYQFWVEGEPNSRFSERCVVLQGRKQFRWAGWNCGYQKDGQTLFKALCQKESFQKLVTTTTPQSPTNSEQIKSPRLDTQCAVFGVSLSGDDWLSRHSNVDSASTCHNDCLNTRGCNVWTWRSDSKLCYLKNKDAAVVKDVLAVSGTTSTKQGCNRDILQSSSISQPTKVEYCSCKTVSHDVVSGYIDPRALPEADDLSNLGRFIRHNACPNGQVLTCSDVPSHVSSNQDFAPKTSNITQCLVHDVRLTVGGHVGVIPHVDSAETCHNYCLIHKECAYWTWRGETLDRKCFMLPHEGRLVRRQGSSSGTVTRDQGCDHKIVSPEPEAAQYREDSEIECECERDSNTNDIDYVGLGLIDPRSVPEEADDSNTTPSPSGRIVNINRDDGEINCYKKCSAHCPNGWKPVCPSTVEEPKHHNNVVASNNNFNDGPKLFTGTLGQFPIGEEYARPRNIPKRELGTEEKKSDHSAVSFPQAEVISY